MGQNESGTRVRRPVEVPATTVAIALLIGCLLLFMGVSGYFATGAIRQTNASLEERSQSAAQVVATNAEWMVQVANQTLRRVDAVVGPTIDADPGSIENAVEGLPAKAQVYLVNPEGRTTFSTIPGTENINVSDREYFSALRDGAISYTSGLLVSRLTGESIFVFSRRLSRNGQFAGAIVISFPDTVIQSFWAGLNLDDTDSVALIRRDGELMARYPRPKQPINLASTALFTDYLPNAEAGSYFSAASAIDGIARVVSYRAVAGTQIVAVASISSDEAWARMRRTMFDVVLIVLPMVIALMAVGVWVLRLLRRDAKRRDELEAANETNVLLFREIHHRVKNNLQSVQSLVRMQDMPKNAKIDLQSRLSAMAAMHEHIYRNDKYEDIDAHELVPVVVDEVAHAYGADSTLRYDVDHAVIDRDHITPLSLLLSELVTNAFKYAFPDGRKGTILVKLTDLGGGRCKLCVSDDGIGIGTVPQSPTSMGLRLVRGVVSQMGGSYAFITEEGTRFEAELALTAAGHLSSPTFA